MGVVLLVEVRVVLLRRGGACTVLVSQTLNGKVTGEPEFAQQPVDTTPRSMQTEVVDHAI